MCSPLTKDGYEYNQFIGTYLHACAYTPMDIAAAACGLANIAVWLFAQAPQLYKVYKVGKVEAVSPAFLAAWVIGDVANLAGSILTHQLPYQVFTAIYFVCMDSLMLTQYFYYRCKSDPEKDAPPLLAPNSPPRHNHPSHPSHQGYPPPQGMPQGQSRRVQAMGVFLTLGLGMGLIATLSSSPIVSSPIEHISHVSQPLGEDGYLGGRVLMGTGMGSTNGTVVGHDCEFSSGGAPWQYVVGIVISWVSGLLYFYARIPQAILNWKRKATTGISGLMFMATLTANLLYSMSILLAGPDFHSSKFWAATSSFLVGTLGVMAESLFILFQVWLYRNNTLDVYDSINSSAPSDAVSYASIGAASYGGRIWASHTSNSPWPYASQAFRSV